MSEVKTEPDLDAMVASSDTGGRKPANPVVAKIIAGVALLWSLFQLWIASPLPFIFGVGVFLSLIHI